MSVNAPLFSLIPKSDRHEYERLRGIENEYQIEMVAENVRQLVQFHAATLRMQAGQAARTLRNFAVMLTGREAPEEFLENIEDNMGVLVNGMDRLTIDKYFSSDFSQISFPAVYDSKDASEGLQGTLIEYFERQAKLVLREQRELRQVTTHLSEKYESQSLDLRTEAEKWLMSGMNRVGGDRDEDFNDALRLLRDVVEGPFGMQDYVAWFQIGWLLWKHDKNISEAEDAFYRAQRLSAAGGDLYYVKSLRHLAYAQHLQGRHGDAYDTIQKALDVSVDHDTRFDAARYAATRGYSDECLALLEQCIRERPTTIISMFTEIDFLRGSGASRIAGEMAELAAHMLTEARERAEKTVNHWSKAVKIVRNAETEAGIDFELPETVGEQAIERIPDINSVDYLMALEIERKALANGDEAVTFSCEALRTEVRSRVAVLSRVQLELQELQFKEKSDTQKLDMWRESQITDMPTLTRSVKKGMLPNLLFSCIGIYGEVSLIPTVKAALGVHEGISSGSMISSDLYVVYLGLAWLAISYAVFIVALGFDSVLRFWRQSRIEEEYRDLAEQDVLERNAKARSLHDDAAQAEIRKAKAEIALSLLQS